MGASVRWLGRVAVAAVGLVAQGRIVPEPPHPAPLRRARSWTSTCAGRRPVSTTPRSTGWPAPCRGRCRRAVPQGRPRRHPRGDRRRGRRHRPGGRREARAARPPPRSSATPPTWARPSWPASTAHRSRPPSRPVPRCPSGSTSGPSQVTGVAKTTLVVQLDPPDRGDAWFLSVLGRGAEGGLLPIEQALTDSKRTQHLADEIVRLERIYDKLGRAGGLRRGQVYLSQDEAWELMTVTGPCPRGGRLRGAGARAVTPQAQRPRCACSWSPRGAGGGRPPAQRRPLVGGVRRRRADGRRRRPPGRRGPAPRAARTASGWSSTASTSRRRRPPSPSGRDADQLTGAEILRHVVGLEGTPFGAGLTVEGSGWVTDLLEPRPRDARPPPRSRSQRGSSGSCARTRPRRSAGSGFLDAVELGGCLALDMGLGKTPTVLAHLARTAGQRPGSGDRPSRRGGQLGGRGGPVHPRSARWSSTTARRGRRPRSSRPRWPTPTSSSPPTAPPSATSTPSSSTTGTASCSTRPRPSRTTPTRRLSELRRIGARTRLALTGTPIENGLGDLWSILDFTNPGLVGARTTFIAQLSGEGEAALRALNGILVFRRTKTEPAWPPSCPDRIDELDHCTMTAEQIGLYQAVLDGLVVQAEGAERDVKQGAILAAITALKQICNHPWNYQAGRQASGGSVRQAQPARGGGRPGLLGWGADPRSSPSSPPGAFAWPSTSPSSPASRSAATTAGWPAGLATP